MTLSSLSSDAQRVIFVQLSDALDPGVAMAFGSITSELWTLTRVERQQLRDSHEAAAQRCATSCGCGTARSCAR